MSSLAGAEVRTIEDISANGLHPVQKMWMRFNVPQCGYCQSGQIMQAIALLKDKPRMWLGLKYAGVSGARFPHRIAGWAHVMDGRLQGIRFTNKTA
jgi:aerobic-type carbon monoxide dehydrogenase small subunit (CoxS/CutS family)